MDPAIVNAQRSGTAAMLAVIGDDYVVTRGTRTRTLSGGYVEGPASVVGVIRMVVDAGDPSLVRNAVSRSVEGKTKEPNLNITAAWDSGLQEGDHFLWKGRLAVVEDVTIDHDADTTASAVLHG